MKFENDRKADASSLFIALLEILKKKEILSDKDVQEIMEQ